MALGASLCRSVVFLKQTDSLGGLTDRDYSVGDWLRVTGMKQGRFFTIALAAVTILNLAGCTKESDDNGSTGQATAGELRTDCGTVFNGQINNPPKASKAQVGSVRFIGSNLVSMKLKDGEQLIKLHGLGTPYEDYKNSGARTVITELAAEGDALFYIATEDCQVTLSDGGKGVIGHVFSAQGKSFSETLIKKGYAQVSSDSCQGNLISTCYSALEDQTAQTIAGELTEFLWKPVSDSNGKLAVHTGPYGTSVIVNGETGANQGGGNGFGSLARFSKPGCSYGANVKVQVVNENGASYYYKGQPFITIPNGCQRYKIKGGTLAPDKK